MSRPGLTARQQLRGRPAGRLLAAAKRLIASTATSACGLRTSEGGRVSGPAVYRHFASKDAVLAALLVGISHTLYDGGERIRESAASPGQALLDLVAYQVDFALSDPELILIYDRDRFHLPAEDLHDRPSYPAGVRRDLGRRDPGGRAVRQRGGGPHRARTRSSG